MTTNTCPHCGHYDGALRSYRPADVPSDRFLFTKCERCRRGFHHNGSGDCMVDVPAVTPTTEAKAEPMQGLAEPRFFIDHNVIHDRLTGRHVTTDVELESPCWPGINDCLRLLNELADAVDRSQSASNALTNKQLCDAIVAEMSPLCEKHSYWTGWPGSWSFAQAAIRVFDRLGFRSQSAGQEAGKVPAEPPGLYGRRGIRVRDGATLATVDCASRRDDSDCAFPECGCRKVTAPSAAGSEGAGLTVHLGEPNALGLYEDSYTTGHAVTRSARARRPTPAPEGQGVAVTDAMVNAFSLAERGEFLRQGLAGEPLNGDAAYRLGLVAALAASQPPVREAVAPAGGPLSEEERAELQRLRALINTPHTAEWMQAVELEAAHQIERHGSEHDAGKEPQDWFWLLGYLAGKALASLGRGDQDKGLHHIVSSGAALLNWHRAVTGFSNSMRPGILPHTEGEANG